MESPLKSNSDVGSPVCVSVMDSGDTQGAIDMVFTLRKSPVWLGKLDFHSANK